MTNAEELTGRDARELPSAFDGLEWLAERLTDSELVVFLDYDGTLTPIVSQPEDALLSEQMRQVLDDLSRMCTVAIVSGRDLDDVFPMVDLPGLIFAGSHGFDIRGPNDLSLEYEGGVEHLPDLERAEGQLRDRIEAISGARVERKRFAIANHYRNVAEGDVPALRKAVEEVAAGNGRLRLSGGKKVLELRPDIEWDKGRAVLWLLNALDLERDKVVPIYIGDDVTDEDAFRAVRDSGVGIVVGEPPYPTMARFSLKDTSEVQSFIGELIDLASVRES
jgi:alpha,alpha-trehalase